MKKVILSAFVIVTFILYSLIRRENTIASVPLTTPSQTPSDTPTGTSSQSPTSSPSQTVPLTATPTPPQQPGVKDGSYTGDSVNAFWGNIQVKATISGGKLTDVAFLSYPNDRGHSIEVSQYALPILRKEAIQNQTAQVDIVSGATDTSNAFIQSLASALSQSK